MSNYSLKWILIIGAVLRLLLAIVTEGTQDIAAWNFFRESILEVGISQTYLNIKDFNHPPLVAYLLLLSKKIPIQMAIRIPNALAEIGSAYLIFKILVTLKDQKTAFWSASILSLSPMLIAVSSFHGNTDSIFIFLIILAIYLQIYMNNTWVTSLLIGLAINIKLVPIVIVPTFFLWLSNRKQKLIFASIIILSVIVGYGSIAIEQPLAIYQNIFSYKSSPGHWGLSLLVSWLPISNASIALELIKWIMLGTILTVAFLNNYDHAVDQKLRLTNGIAYTFLIFLALTPGYGPQYMSWLVTAAFLSLPGFIWLNAMGSIYILSLYSYWSGSIFWNIADASRQHIFLDYLSLIPWLTILYIVSMQVLSTCSKTPRATNTTKLF